LDALPAAPAGGTGALAPEPDPAALAGTVVAGRYKLLQEIGEGGMGTVWMAEQTAPVKRLVALKLVKPGMDSRQVLARFEAERQALALMDHPNIAKVLDGGTTEHGRPYFVMELVKGVSITNYCDDRRFAATIAGEGHMITAYGRGEDLHTRTAQAVLGKADVTKADRQLAKAVNFGLLYGMGARGFCRYARTNYGVELTEAQAKTYRRAFFAAYPALKRWHSKVGGTGHRPIATRTLAGRRCLAVERFTEKLNLGVQGTGADGLKAALALLWERRAECLGAVPVVAVHDEIVIECDAAQAAAAVAWLRQAMLDGMAPLAHPVPVEVEVSVAPTWGG
jgi:hypothetical protein